MLKILHLKLQSEVLRQILPHWIARLEFNFRRKILRLEFYPKPQATELGKILARTSELQNSARNSEPQNPREILPAKFTGKILWRIAYRNFASIIKFAAKLGVKFQTMKFRVEFQSAKFTRNSTRNLTPRPLKS